MKVIHKIFILLVALVLIVSALLYHTFYSSVKQISIRYETLKDTKIPEQLDNVQIAYFSDMNYGENFNEQQLVQLVDKLEMLSPDVIVFGGDLFTSQHNVINEEEKQTMIDQLKSLNAPLGKFAVLGDFDIQNETIMQTVTDILYQANFEILTNNAIAIHNQGSQSINLIGIENIVNGTQNITQAFAKVSSNSYNIVVCNTPDIAQNLPEDLTNYLISGHSLGGQIFYLFGASYTPKGAEKYLNGKHSINHKFTLDISDGLGPLNKNIRFLTNNEVVLYRLSHK